MFVEKRNTGWKWHFSKMGGAKNGTGNTWYLGVSSWRHMTLMKLWNCSGRKLREQLTNQFDFFSWRISLKLTWNISMSMWWLPRNNLHNNKIVHFNLLQKQWQNLLKKIISKQENSVKCIYGHNKLTFYRGSKVQFDIQRFLFVELNCTLCKWKK